MTVPATTKLAIRLDTPLSSATSSLETPIRGELVEPVVVDGVTVIPSGASVTGVVTDVRSSGKVKGRASLELQFNQLTAHGERHELDARFARTAPSTRGSDAKKIAIPAVGGAIVGAIIGGNKGAAIGAAAGGGAGTAVVLTSAGPEVTLGEGTVLSLSAGRLLVGTRAARSTGAKLTAFLRHSLTRNRLRVNSIRRVVGVAGVSPFRSSTPE